MGKFLLLALCFSACYFVSGCSKSGDDSWSIKLEQSPPGSKIKKSSQERIYFTAIVKNSNGKRLAPEELNSFEEVTWKSNYDARNYVFQDGPDKAFIDCALAPVGKKITVYAEMFFKDISAEKSVTLTAD